IDLIPIEPGSFDVIIGVNWLTRNHAMTICDKKIVRIPLDDETLMIRSNMSDGYASIVASTKYKSQKTTSKETFYKSKFLTWGAWNFSSQRRMDPLGFDTTNRELNKTNRKEPLPLPSIANVAADALSRKERAKPLRVGALVMTINSNLPPQIHEAQVEALKKENVKDENLHVVPMARHGSRHRHLYQQVLDVFKDEGRLSEAIRFTGVIRFGKRGKLNPRYIGPFKIIAKVGTIAYHLELLEKLSRVHSTFHVSKLKKCLADEPLAIPLDEIQVDYKLHFIEEPVKIMDREVKRLKQSRIPIFKVRCNSRRGPEFTWEREDQIQKKYPHLFTNSAPATEVAS
ncbi:hypothetical protein Tco_1467471, partial [Tanacetum coccineum]